MAFAERRLPPADQIEALYRAHAAHVHAICASVLRDRHEAEDATQQVFVSALRALLSGTEPRDPAAWLTAIARNESWIRARRASPMPLERALQDARQEDPAILVARQDELARVWQAIESLPLAQRNALLLRALRGLSYDELAAGLDLSHPSVRSLLNRARHTLRAQLRRGAAAAGGAPWLQLFARLFGDGPNPTLSAASRTAAVGLGALVLTGGAALVPSATEHVRHPAPAMRQVATGSHLVQRVATGPAARPHPAPPVVVARVPSRPAAVAPAHVDRRSGRRGGPGPVSVTSAGGSDSRGGPGPSSISSSGDGGGPGPSTASFGSDGGGGRDGSGSSDGRH